MASEHPVESKASVHFAGITSEHPTAESGVSSKVNTQSSSSSSFSLFLLFHHLLNVD
jgi:hypothetical protein